MEGKFKDDHKIRNKTQNKDKQSERRNTKSRKYMGNTEPTKNRGAPR